MKQYNSYKPSGVEWIGDIPENWGVSKLKYFLSEIITGGTPDTSIDEYWIDNGINWISISDITSSPDGILETKKTISEEGRRSKTLKVLEPNSLIYSIYGSIGKVNRIKVPSTIHQGILSFITNDKLNNYFLEKYLIFIQPFISSFSSSNTQDNLNQDKIKNLFIHVPPLQEQEQIVKFLDEKTSIIDKLISTKEKKIELLKEQRTSLINEVITKGLNPNVKMKDSGVEWIGKIPESWRVGKLNFYSDRIGDGLHSTPNYDDNGEFYFINGNNIKDGKVILTENTRKVNEIEFNNHFIKLSNSHTLLLSINGTIGNVSYYNDEKVILGKSVGYINLKNSSIDIDFLYWLLLSKSIQNYFQFELTGTTIYNLSLNSIRKTPILIPSSKEQQEIVEYLDKHTKEIDDLVSLEQKKIELLKEYRQSLISEVITGKIKVVE